MSVAAAETWNRDVQAAHPQFLRTSPVCDPHKLPVFAGESPRPAELLCSLRTALRSKVHQDL